MSISTESSFVDSEDEEQARGRLWTRFGTVTVIPVDVFLARALPPLPQGVSAQAISLEDHWSDLAEDPSRAKCDPSLASNYFPGAVSAIMKAGGVSSNRPCKSMVFQNNPVYVDKSEDRKQGGLPNAYLLLGEGATWANVVASGEYKKTDNKWNRRDVSVF